LKLFKSYRFKGKKSYPLSKDHRPTDEKEYSRVLKAGGKIYQTEANFFKGQNNTENIVGPLRVMPGKLSVSRAFGNIEAKSPLFNGNPNVIIAKPDIKYFDINQNFDFIVIGCDGIFENMKNKELIEIIWKNTYKETTDVHNKCGILVESVINECINKKFTDNLTVVLIAFNEDLKSINNGDKYILNTEQVNKQQKFIEVREKNNINLNNSKFTLNSVEKTLDQNETPTPKMKDYGKLNNFEFYSNNTNNNNQTSRINKNLLETIFKNTNNRNDKKPVEHKFFTFNDNKENNFPSKNKNGSDNYDSFNLSK